MSVSSSGIQVALAGLSVYFFILVACRRVSCRNPGAKARPAVRTPGTTGLAQQPGALRVVVLPPACRVLVQQGGGRPVCRGVLALMEEGVGGA